MRVDLFMEKSINKVVITLFITIMAKSHCPGPMYPSTHPHMPSGGGRAVSPSKGK